MVIDNLPAKAHHTRCTGRRTRKRTLGYQDSQHQLKPCVRGSGKQPMKPKWATILTATMIINFAWLTPTHAHHTPKKPLPCPQWHDALRKHGLPVEIFAPIMWRESRCQPKAVGWNYHKNKSHRDCKKSHARTYRKCKAVKSYDIGLLQINSSWKSLTAKTCNYRYGKMLILQRPSCNLKVAAILYDNGRGVSNWRATSGATISTGK